MFTEIWCEILLRSEVGKDRKEMEGRVREMV
jgi:hypothetical protein